MADDTQTAAQGQPQQITEQGLEQAMFQKIGQNEQNIIKRVYLAGMALLFSQKTHKQFLNEFMQQLKQQNQQHDLGSILGTDIVHIMLLLFGESKGTMPKGALIPAGTLLLAKVMEFINDSHIAQMTPQDFAQAAHLMATVLHAKFDKNYAKQLSSASESGNSPVASGNLPLDAPQSTNAGMLQGAQ